MHEQDKKWVRQQMNKLPSHLRPDAYLYYDTVFNDAGRRAANTRLRIYVERITNG